MAATLFDDVADVETADERLARLDREAEAEDRASVLSDPDLDPCLAEFGGLGPDDRVMYCMTCTRPLVSKETRAGRAHQQLPEAVFGYRRDRKRVGHARPVCRGCWCDDEEGLG